MPHPSPKSESPAVSAPLPCPPGLGPVGGGRPRPCPSQPEPPSQLSDVVSPLAYFKRVIACYTSDQLTQTLHVIITAWAAVVRIERLVQCIIYSAFCKCLHRTKGGFTASDTVGLVVEYAPATGETRVRFPDGVALSTNETSLFIVQIHCFLVNVDLHAFQAL